MTIDSGTVRDLAQLARLQLSEDEIERARRRIDALLASFDSIASVETTATPPHDRGGDEAPRSRADVADAPLERTVALANAPRTQGGQFVVPRVVER